MMATNNVIMQEDRKIASTHHLERHLQTLKCSIDRALVLVGLASHPSRAQTFVGVVMCHISAYPLLSAYCHSVYRYKRMRLLTRVYGMPYHCNEGKIQEFRRAPVFNHSCVVKLDAIMYQSQNKTSVLLILSWTRLSCIWTR